MKVKQHITMDATVVEIVGEMAIDEGRSFSNMVNRLVTEAINTRKEDNPRAISVVDDRNASEQATMDAIDRKGGYQ